MKESQISNTVSISSWRELIGVIVKQETKQKRNETKWDTTETKQDKVETKQKRNETKRNETKKIINKYKNETNINKTGFLGDSFTWDNNEQNANGGLKNL